MKYFSILPLVLVGTLILSACGASAEPITAPTVNVADMQNTMAAAAFTMIAETQTAIPTATPLPPTATFTNIAAPASTLPGLPSSAVTLTPVPNGNTTGDDPCVNQVLPATLQGEAVKIRINNSTRATMRVSVYLNRNGPQGQCGYRAYNLEPGQSVGMNDLVEGCYTLFAWNIDPEEYFIVSNGTSCIDNSDTWIFDISSGDIRLRT
jgi:hypothetical protein